MRFEWPSDEEFQGGQQAAAMDEKDRPLLPEGTHTVSIVWAGEQVRDWAKHEKDNPAGTVLSVKLDCGPKWQPVWESIRTHWRGAIEALCRSARVAPPTSGQEWSEKDLVGQWVTIETVNAISKAGREYVKIEKWRAGPPINGETVKVETRAARTPAAKVKASAPAIGSDDIPFLWLVAIVASVIGGAA